MGGGEVGTEVELVKFILCHDRFGLGVEKDEGGSRWGGPGRYGGCWAVRGMRVIREGDMADTGGVA